MGKNRDKKLN